MPTIETTYEKGPFTATVIGELEVRTETEGHNLSIEEVVIEEIEVTELWCRFCGRDYRVHKDCYWQACFEDDELRDALEADNAGTIKEEFERQGAEYGETLHARMP